MQAAPEVFGTAIQGDRSEQQDSFRSIWLRGEQAWLLVIADGMGGHAAGGVASKVAADTFVASFIERRAQTDDIKTALNIGLNAANNQIQASQSASFELRGMGTTLVAAYISAETLAWISVGDSPLWHWHAGRMKRLNEDHSLRAVLPADKQARANMLTSALTGETIAQIDCGEQSNTLEPGDCIILGSDGILTLHDDEISDTVAAFGKAGSEAVARGLIDNVCSRAKPQQDNCTLIVAQMGRPTAPNAREQTSWPRWAVAFGIAAVSGLVGMVWYFR